MAVGRLPTLLSLDRFALLMGINPAHFNQATPESATTTYMPMTNRCSDLWYQESWIGEADGVGREDLTLAIYDAENDLARELGWWPAPKWTSQDLRQFPRHYRPDVFRIGGSDVRGQRVGVNAAFGKIISPGRRGLTTIGNATIAGGGLAYSDADGDGFSETATVTIATALTNADEIKVYFGGQGGAPEWEIRPPRTRQITGGNFVATFWVWQLIDPDLWTFITTNDNVGGINVADTSTLVTTVDVRREFNDVTQASVEFLWEPSPRNLLPVGSACSCGGIGCVACSFTTQDGCLHIRNADFGEVVPTPATYNATTAVWDQVAFTCARDPDQVTLWYYSGNLDQRWLSGLSGQPLSDYWAQAIAWLAISKLERPFCQCGVLTALAKKLQRDMALVDATSHSLPFDLLANPFGSKRGAIMAWQRVKSEPTRVPGVALA